MTLRILTHTRSLNTSTLSQCVESVERVMSKDMEHKVIVTNTHNDWARSRFSEVMSTDYSAFVDDDDVVFDVLSDAYDIAKSHDIGLVCFPEIIVYSKKVSIETSFNKTYDAVRFTPLELHHLCIINSKYVDKDLFSILKKKTNLIGMDWMIKASAALNGGALVVRRHGYRWDSTNHHRDKAVFHYRDAMPALRMLTYKWGRDKKGVIPSID